MGERTRSYITVLLFLALTVFLFLNDEAVFSEINDKYAQFRLLRYYRHQITEEEYNEAFSLDDKYRSTAVNIILIWNPMFGQMRPTGTYFKDDTGCVVTYDRSAIDVAKAVVFHFAEIHDNPSWLPMQHRKENQRWVWWCMEPPWNSRYVFRKQLSPLRNVFNWTMTYRTDSDIYFPYYGNLEMDNKTTAQLVAEKTAKSLGIWIVSNCRPSHRGRIIEELQKYVSIDVFGKCTNKPLCRGACAYETIKRYKFYFSFENSRCKDYITEKFTQNGLAGGAVPVVMGPAREDYEKIAPANSFVHVDDFPSIQKLAEYLLLLDKDDKKYGEYLKWRSIPDSPKSSEILPLFNQPLQFKALCDKIKHDPQGLKKETVSNLDTWWFGEGYSPDNNKLSVCHPDDGPSGTALHHYIVAGYLLGASLVCFLIIKSFKLCKKHRSTKSKIRDHNGIEYRNMSL